MAIHVSASHFRRGARAQLVAIVVAVVPICLCLARASQSRRCVYSTYGHDEDMYANLRLSEIPAVSKVQDHDPGRACSLLVSVEPFLYCSGVRVSGTRRPRAGRRARTATRAEDMCVYLRSSEILKICEVRYHVTGSARSRRTGVEPTSRLWGGCGVSGRLPSRMCRRDT